MFLLILCVVTGIIAGALTAFLDFCMLRGEILEGIRIYFAKRAAKRIDRARGNSLMSDMLNEVLYETKYDTFDTRINETNYAYWQIALHDKRFVAWMCPTCLNVRVTLLVFILTLAVFWSFFPSWGVILIFYLGVFTVSFLLISKIG